MDIKIHFISVTHPEIQIDIHHKIVSIFGFCSLEYYMLFVLCHSFVIGETYIPVILPTLPRLRTRSPAHPMTWAPRLWPIKWTVPRESPALSLRAFIMFATVAQTTWVLAADWLYRKPWVPCDQSTVITFMSLWKYLNVQLRQIFYLTNETKKLSTKYRLMIVRYIHVHKIFLVFFCK